MHERARLISGTELIAALEKLGFERVRQKPSHVVLKRTLLLTLDVWFDHIKNWRK